MAGCVTCGGSKMRKEYVFCDSALFHPRLTASGSTPSHVLTVVDQVCNFLLVHMAVLG